MKRAARALKAVSNELLVQRHRPDTAGAAVGRSGLLAQDTDADCRGDGMELILS